MYKVSGIVEVERQRIGQNPDSSSFPLFGQRDDGINEHPTQALLDSFSIQEKTGSLKGRKVAIIGDIMHSRVAMSNMYCLRKMGAEVVVCGPPTLIPKHIEAMGVTVTYQVREALEWCDVANVWIRNAARR